MFFGLILHSDLSQGILEGAPVLVLKIQYLLLCCDLRICQTAAWPDKGAAVRLTGSFIADGTFWSAEQSCSLTPAIGRQAFEFETEGEQRFCKPKASLPVWGVTGSDSLPPSFGLSLLVTWTHNSAERAKALDSCSLALLHVAFKDPRQTYTQLDPSLRIGFRQNIDPYRARLIIQEE